MTNLNEKLNFSWVIPNQLAASGLPINKADLKWLVKKQNITHIITLTYRTLNKRVKYLQPIKKDLAFKHYHIPTQDGDGFFPHQFDKIINIYNNAVQLEQSVLVHCEGGFGRTSTALTAIWLSINNKSMKQSIKELQKIRTQLIHTDLQLASLKEWLNKKM